MAASYIRIAILVLTGISILGFMLGFAVGTGVRNARLALRMMSGVGIILLVVFALGLRALPISGVLIERQVIFLWLNIVIALIGGCFVGAMRKSESKRDITRTFIMFAFIVVGMIVLQVGNVRPVLDMLQTAGLLKPKDDYKPETNKDCPANLQSLYNAFEQYAELNDKLPEAANWEDNSDLTSRVPQDEWLHCPAVSNRHDAHFGYALNDALAGKKLNLNGKSLKTLPNASTTPLLYDSTNLSKNAHDAVTSLPKPGRHGGRNNILYLDGHVAAVVPK
jgi:prepilin-type processing-associated H-X9-DG protein